MLLRQVVLFAALSCGAAWAQDEMTPPLPPPEPPPQQLPPPQAPPGVLVPRTIANPPLSSLPPSNGPPAAPPTADRRERFGARFGPMGHLAINGLNALWDRSAVLPGLAGTLGLRFALLPRSDFPQFNVAASAFFGLESLNFVPTLSPGLRLELVGVRGPVLIPYLSFSVFGQVVAPVFRESVRGRVGVAFAWNLAALPGSGRWADWGGGGGGSSWLIVPIAIVAALIAFGDVRLYIQTDPRGPLTYGLSVGVGF